MNITISFSDGKNIIYDIYKLKNKSDFFDGMMPFFQTENSDNNKIELDIPLYIWEQYLNIIFESKLFFDENENLEFQFEKLDFAIKFLCSSVDFDTLLINTNSRYKQNIDNENKYKEYKNHLYVILFIDYFVSDISFKTNKFKIDIKYFTSKYKNTIYEKSIKQCVNRIIDLNDFIDSFYFTINNKLKNIKSSLLFSRIAFSNYISNVGSIIEVDMKYFKTNTSQHFTQRLIKMIGTEWKWVENSFNKDTNTFNFPSGIILAGGSLFTCMSDRNMDDVIESEDIDFWVYGDSEEIIRNKIINAIKFFSQDVDVYYSIYRSIITLTTYGSTARNIQLICGNKNSPEKYIDSYDINHLKGYYNGIHCYLTDEFNIALHDNVCDLEYNLYDVRFFKCLRYNFKKLDSKPIWSSYMDFENQKYKDFETKEQCLEFFYENIGIDNSINKFVRIINKNIDINKIIIKNRLYKYGNVIYGIDDMIKYINCENIDYFSIGDEGDCGGYLGIVTSRNYTNGYYDNNIKFKKHPSIIQLQINNIKNIETREWTYKLNDILRDSYFINFGCIRINFNKLTLCKSEYENRYYSIIDQNCDFYEYIDKLNNAFNQLMINNAYKKIQENEHYKHNENFERNDVFLFKKIDDGKYIINIYDKHELYKKKFNNDSLIDEETGIEVKTKVEIDNVSIKVYGFCNINCEFKLLNVTYK